MIKFIRILLTAIIIVLFSACEDRIPPPDYRMALQGTWVMNRVAVSGYGYFEGTAAISFDAGGGYRSDVNFRDPDSGCEAYLFYAGTFSATDTTITSKIKRGELEMTGCADEAANSSRAYSQAELEAASTTADYIIIGNTLELFTCRDNLNRVFVKQ